MKANIRECLLKELVALIEAWARSELTAGRTEVNVLYRVMRGEPLRCGHPGHRVLAGYSQPEIARMRSAMRQLPRSQRDALWLKYSRPIDPVGRPYTNSQLARFLGLSTNAFRNRIHRGKRRLSALLNQK